MAANKDEVSMLSKSVHKLRRELKVFRVSSVVFASHSNVTSSQFVVDIKVHFSMLSLLITLQRADFKT